jgi:hypothetical protein
MKNIDVSSCRGPDFPQSLEASREKAVEQRDLAVYGLSAEGRGLGSPLRGGLGLGVDVARSDVDSHVGRQVEL